MDSIIQEVEYTLTINGAKRRTFTCSPWNVKELVIGSLFTLGEIDRFDQVLKVIIDDECGMVDIELISPAVLRQNGPGFSSFIPITSSLTVAMADVKACMSLLESRSLLFRRTGGVHSAVLADSGKITAWFEDIGRHNALDKLVGWCLLNSVDVADKMILFSGRVPQEIAERVIRLGCPIVSSPGAPTTRSIEFARRWGLTLIGFAKGDAFNVYAHPERVV